MYSHTVVFSRTPEHQKISGKRLGRPRKKYDSRTLRLDKYTRALPVAPPVEAGYIKEVAEWPMYLNDQLGDCVIAAAGHMVEQWNQYAGKPGRLTDEDILKGYEAVGGYIPGVPATDNGCFMLDALKYWRTNGFGGHKIRAFVRLSTESKLLQSEFQQAMELFGNVYIGVALPVSAQSAPRGGNMLPCWAVPGEGAVGNGEPGSWGGHCVPLVGYSAAQRPNQGTIAVTWGQLYDVTWNFLSAYCDEAYAVISEDWIEANGTAPSGFDLCTLLADLEQITA